MKEKKQSKKSIKKQDNFNKLAKAIIEESYSSKKKIIGHNFLRGIAFGFGSAIGGTIVIGLLFWFLAKMVNWVPFTAEFIKEITKYMNMG